MPLSNKKIAIIGLGYVGLPLAVAFSEKYHVVGFDINANRVYELNLGNDRTLEVTPTILKKALLNSKTFNTNQNGLFITNDIIDISIANIFIITVPTPIDKHNRPQLELMINASQMIAKYLKKNDIVIYESTVYPGVTEEEMVPVLENFSGLKYNIDFFCGYSPERINPGDKEHTVTKILKITSGSTIEIAEIVDKLYSSVITAGTYKASSIKVAEAAKVIENTQRDINIAFVNELSKIFNLINLDTIEVLEAAGTKWNFLKFKPGLVGGHCIGVDPYYLAQKAQEVGYYPEIILAGRRLNDSMGKHIATEVIKLMLRKDIKVVNSNILILGFTFKENCPDVRNTRVIDIYNELKNFDTIVDIYDPIAYDNDVKNIFGIEIIHDFKLLDLNKYSAIIIAVAHNEFLQIPISTSSNIVVYDIKGILNKELVDARL